VHRPVVHSHVGDPPWSFSFSFVNKDNADGQQARQICAEAAMEDLKKFLGAGRYDAGAVD
jgi:hypothetical protein